MSYYDDNNKIRRKKVSSSSSNTRTTSRTTTVNRDSRARTNNTTNKRREVNNKTAKNNRISKRKKLKKNKSKKFLRFIKNILVLFLIVGLIASATLTVFVNLSLKGGPTMSYSYLKQKSIALKVNTNDPESLKYVDMVDIPVNLRNAVVSIEDERFDKHKGIDSKALARSVIHNIFSKSTQGGSTIEMQLSKNLVTDLDQTMQRKIKDMYNAKQMNKNMNKREILELYLNSIYLGSSKTPIYGVAKGAQVYFGKDIKDLDLGECAMLAGITNNPKLYSKDYEAAKNRRNVILYKMKQLKYITNDEYEVAKKKETPMKTSK